MIHTLEMIDKHGIISTMYFDSIAFKLFDGNKQLLNLNKRIDIDTIEHHFKITRLDGFLSNKSVISLQDGKIKAVVPRQLRYILTGKTRNDTLSILKSIKQKINFSSLTSVIFTIHPDTTINDAWEELRMIHFELIHKLSNCTYSLHIPDIYELNDIHKQFITNAFHRIRIVTNCSPNDLLQFTLSLDKSWNKQCLKLMIPIKQLSDISLIETEKYVFEYNWDDDADFDSKEFLSLLLKDTKIFNNGFVSDIYETFALLGDLLFEYDLTKSNCEATHKFTTTIMNDNIVLCNKYNDKLLGELHQFSSLQYPELFTISNNKFDCIHCPVISRCCGCCPRTTPVNNIFNKKCTIHHKHYMVMLAYALYILTDKVMLSCTGLFHNTTIQDVLEHSGQYKSQQIQWFQNKLEQ